MRGRGGAERSVPWGCAGWSRGRGGGQGADWETLPWAWVGEILVSSWVLFCLLLVKSLPLNVQELNTTLIVSLLFFGPALS